MPWSCSCPPMQPPAILTAATRTWLPTSNANAAVGLQGQGNIVITHHVVVISAKLVEGHYGSLLPCPHLFQFRLHRFAHDEEQNQGNSERHCGQPQGRKPGEQNPGTVLACDCVVHAQNRYLVGECSTVKLYNASSKVRKILVQRDCRRIVLRALTWSKKVLDTVGSAMQLQ